MSGRLADAPFSEDSEVIVAAFDDEPLIFIPHRAGKFLPASEVHWKDMSLLFGDARGYLAKHWNDLKDSSSTNSASARDPAPRTTWPCSKS